jgi:sugar lactone lactonase YvrE
VKGGAKLVGLDPATGKVLKKIVFDQTVALPDTYLNDVRFDLSRGAEGMAFITDSSPAGKNAIIVVDLAEGKAWRRLNAHPSTLPEPRFLPTVEGRPLMNRPEGKPASHMSVGADGIAMGPKGEKLYYSALSGRKLFAVDVDDLVGTLPDSELGSRVINLGDKGGAADGLESDTTGAVYLTNYEHNAIQRREADGTMETLVHDPRVLWPDTLSLAADGYLYFTANQLHRQPSYHNGQDLRETPYLLYRTKVDRQPVRLK